MSSALNPDPPGPPVNPRPGFVKAMGVSNVVTSLLVGLVLLGSMAWLIAMMTGQSPPPRVEINASGKPIAAFNPFMGMDEPKFARFCLVDAGTGLVLNAIMFATGIGLLNLRAWGARWWSAVAWVKIARLLLLWGFYIVAVAPALSDSMARNVASMVQQQSGGRGRMLTVDALFRVYSIMNLIVAVSMIGFGSIYPAFSLWVLGRPGFKAALVDRPATEGELP